MDQQEVTGHGHRESRRAVATLPILWTIVSGCREVFRYGTIYSAYALAWAIIAAVAHLTEMVPTNDVSSVEVAYYAASYLPSIVMLVGSAVIFVTVNRAIVLQEIPAWRRVFHVGGRELRVLGFNLLFLAVGYLELALLSILVQFAAGLHSVDVEFLFGGGLLTSAEEAVLWGLLISVTLTPFLGLAFSLAAIDATSGMLRRSAAWSRGYGWRLGAIGFLSGLIVQILAYAPFFIWPDWSDAVSRITVLGLSAVINLLGAGLRAGAFGYAFRVIADGRQALAYRVFD